MKSFNFKNWAEKIRQWAKGLTAVRARGLPALPGQPGTLTFGRFKIPVVDWEKLYRKAFLYNSIAAAICGYFAADLLVASLTPWFPLSEMPRARIGISSDRRDFVAYSGVILPRGKSNLFSIKGLVPDNDEGGGGDGPPVRTSLPLTLLGVIVIQDSKKSVASIEDKGSNQVVAVHEGDLITREATADRIEEGKVIFFNQNTNRREFIELPKDMILASRKAAPASPKAGGIQKTSENHFVIDRKEVDKAMADINTILTDARCVPEFKAGRPAGYRCFQITPGSIYDKLGLKENDIICGLNGQDVNDPSKAFAVLGSLKDPGTRSIQICIERNGMQTNMQYDIN